MTFTFNFIPRWAGKVHRMMKEIAYVQSGAASSDMMALWTAEILGRRRPTLITDKWFAKEKTDG
jgi:hypothetical protein